MRYKFVVSKIKHKYFNTPEGENASMRNGNLRKTFAILHLNSCACARQGDFDPPFITLARPYLINIHRLISESNSVFLISVLFFNFSRAR